MGDGQGNSSALPPFLMKTYEMVDDQGSDSIVSWSPTNKSFIVWDTALFARDLLPRFFKHNNFASFIRQLNTYGFRKIDPEQWEFGNDEFIRGQPQLLKNIHRRKPVHSHSTQNLHWQGNSNPLTESERQGYRDRIDRLGHDRETLSMELKRQKEEREQIESQVRDRLQHMEERQIRIYSFLADKLQKPGLVLNLLLPQADRKRRLPYQQHEEAGTGSEDGIPGTCRIVGSSSVLEWVDRLESSLCFWESIVTDVLIHGHEHSPMDLAQSTTCAQSPTMSYMQLDTDADVPTTITTTTTTNAGLLNEQEEVGIVAQAGVNDVFWEQLLTENPGSSETHLECSKDHQENGKDLQNKSTEYGKYWWNATTGNTLLERIGQLAAGKT